MQRIRRVLAVVVATACLAACSAPAAPAPLSTTRPAPAVTTPRAPVTAAKTTAKPPPFTPPASPGKVTSACPFLGTAELQELLGTSEDLVATEQPADPTFVPGTEFHCRYEDKYVHPWLADLWIILPRVASYRPAQALEDNKKDCGGPATAVAGAGEGAYYCDRAATDDAEMVVTAKRSHGRTRLAIAYVVKHRSEVYAGLAKLLGERL
ncbi:hypothetical protein [Amycolatopsis sp. CA-126428]|uniref:hypothetical protein n=1 Tax=Amycolatopsis sp. CA-126428 TaxID=2073158 RepID=UPI0018EB2C32|nr:hypothetical protein [Amycolatopsis sp. CA-126428]